MESSSQETRRRSRLAANSDTEDEDYIALLNEAYSDDYPTSEDSGSISRNSSSSSSSDASDSDTDDSGGSPSIYASAGSSSNDAYGAVQGDMENHGDERSANGDVRRPPRDFIIVNTQFSPTAVRVRRSAHHRRSGAIVDEVGSMDSNSNSNNNSSRRSSSASSASGDGRDETNEPIVIDTTQPTRTSSSIQLVMDPRSPLSLSRPPPSEDPQAENSTPGRSAKRKRDSRRRSGEKEEDRETADDCDADKRRRSEGTGENGSADTTKRTRIMFKCAVCLDTPDPAVFVHPCGHVFCEACAQGAVQSTRKCPVCRHQMRARDIRILQFRVASIKR